MQERHVDFIILGTGPAGLQAAIHASRRKVSVLVLGWADRSSIFHAHVENFCCIFNLKGEDMLRMGREQAQSFGAEFQEEDVLNISPAENGYAVTLESGAVVVCKALLIATGTKRNRLGVPGEKEYLGRGVSYCVECDGHFFKGKPVAVVGDQSAAVSGAITLSRITGSATLVAGSVQVNENLRRGLAESPAVTVVEGRSVTAIEGDGNGVRQLRLDNGDIVEAEGVFIELGARGIMELALSLGIELDDEMKFIQTDKQQRTNLPGIYAAGDVCGPPWQMAKAVGEGCVAGLEAASYVKRGG